MEHQAVELIGRKQQAAALLYGESGGGGLSALNGDNGGNLLAVLASEIEHDNSVTDLRALFAQHAQETDPAESAWFATEMADDALAPEVSMAPITAAEVMTLSEPVNSNVQPAAVEPTAKGKSQARRRIACPQTAITLDMFAARSRPTVPTLPPAPLSQDLTQLSLF